MADKKSTPTEKRMTTRRATTDEASVAAILGTVAEMTESCNSVDAIVDACAQNLTVIRDFLISCKETLAKKQNCLMACENMQKGLTKLLKCKSSDASDKTLLESVGKLMDEKLQKQSAAPMSYREATTRNVPTIKSVRTTRPAKTVQKHKVIVKPTAKCAGVKCAEDTKRILTSKKQEQYGVKVDRIVTLRDNSVLLESACASVLKLGDSELLKSLNLEAKPISKNWPRMQVLDVPEKITAEEMEENLRQKQNLPEYVPENFLGKIFKFGGSNKKQGSSTTTWIVEVHPAARNYFSQVGRIFTSWRSHTIRDFVLVSRCYQCQRFGHIAKFCTSQKQCGFCASTEHESKDCTSREKPECHKCANCLRSGAREVNHHTAQDKCPIYQHRLQEKIDSTDYDFDG